jgi:GTPase SAR1 family protein
MILQEQTSRSSRRVGTCIIVGDAAAGKASLWKALLQSQPNGTTPRIVQGNPLLYGYLEFDGTDEQSDSPQKHRVDLWAVQQPEETVKGSPDGRFLSCVLNSVTISETVIFLCLDLSNPSDIAKSLSGWIELLQSHITSIAAADQVSSENIDFSYKSCFLIH